MNKITIDITTGQMIAQNNWASEVATKRTDQQSPLIHELYALEALMPQFKDTMKKMMYSIYQANRVVSCTIIWGSFEFPRPMLDP